ncbi:Hypothetical predicted protein, partial [Pelobates cultripes]
TAETGSAAENEEKSSFYTLGFKIQNWKGRFRPSWEIDTGDLFKVNASVSLRSQSQIQKRLTLGCTQLGRHTVFRRHSEIATVSHSLTIADTGAAVINVCFACLTKASRTVTLPVLFNAHRALIMSLGTAGNVSQDIS